jgi:hypothetical protein
MKQEIVEDMVEVKEEPFENPVIEGVLGQGKINFIL